MNSNRERLFLKHFALASKKLEEKEEVKNNLKTQMQRVKKAALNSKKKSEIEKELNEFENSLKKVLEKENILIREQAIESEITKELREKLNSMEEKMSHMSKYNGELVNALKKEIDELEDELRAAREQKITRDGEEKKKVEKIYQGIKILKEKMQEFIDAKTAHDTRVLELEEKIKKGVSNNYLEILKLEQHLEDMEKRYEQISREGKYDKTMLEEFQEKIIALKNKIWKKKEEFTKEMAKPRLPIPPGPLPPPKFVFPRKKARHEVKFKPVELMMPPPPKPPKKSLLKKLFKK